MPENVRMTAPPKHRLFLDYQSTTPVDSRVLREMLPYFTEVFGNPHSSEHIYGIESYAAIDLALRQIASVIAAPPESLVIVSGATEASNLAIRGMVGKRRRAHFISCVTEHKSVLATLSAMELLGNRITLLPVDADGLVHADDLAKAIRPETLMVSISAANGEIGTVQGIGDIGQVCRTHGVLLHVDAAQAFGRVSLDVDRDGIDLLSISAHKVYGPKGIGALYVRPAIRQQLQPLITGGGQQGGARAGTVPTPLVVGFGAAARLMLEDYSIDQAHIEILRDRFWSGLTAAIPGISLNGSATTRLIGNLNIRIDGVDADSLLLLLPDVALSTGSACSSGALEPSPILQALGLSPEQASHSLRIGFGRMTTVAEVDTAVARLKEAIGQLR